MEKKIKLKKHLDFSGILIPFKNIPEIIRVIENSNNLEINQSKNQISFSYEGVYLVSRVVEGVFPDYKQIIPKEFKTEAIVLKQDLINSLKTSNIFSDKFNQIIISINPLKKSLTIKTKNSEIGENTNTINAVAEGEEVEISFNYKYIIDCFQSIDADSVVLKFNGPSHPLVIQGVSDKTFTYLVMPMNK